MDPEEPAVALPVRGLNVSNERTYADLVNVAADYDGDMATEGSDLNDAPVPVPMSAYGDDEHISSRAVVLVERRTDVSPHFRRASPRKSKRRLFTSQNRPSTSKSSTTPLIPSPAESQNETSDEEIDDEDEYIPSKSELKHETSDDEIDDEVPQSKRKGKRTAARPATSQPPRQRPRRLQVTAIHWLKTSRSCTQEDSTGDSRAEQSLPDVRGKSANTVTSPVRGLSVINRMTELESISAKYDGDTDTENLDLNGASVPMSAGGDDAYIPPASELQNETSEEEIEDEDEDIQPTPQTLRPSSSLQSEVTVSQSKRKGKRTATQPASPQLSRRRQCTSQPPSRHWSKTLRSRTQEGFTGNSGAEQSLYRIQDLTPGRIFNEFFTDDIVDEIVRCTNLNASKELESFKKFRETPSKYDNSWKPVTRAYIRAFFGLKIAKGILKLPTISSYWQTQYPMFEVPQFGKIIGRDRFKMISRFLCFYDVTQPVDGANKDRLYKIRPLLDMLLPKFLSVYTPGKHISIDEALVPFKGRVSFRQSIPSKRARYGIKVWVLAESDTGYVSNLQVYTGRDPGGAPAVGLAKRVVMTLIEPFLSQGYHLYLDNFYSSPDLFETLLEKKVYACGTARPTRTGFPKELVINPKTARRGYSDWLMTDKLLAQSWYDNRPVYFLSTIHKPVSARKKYVKRRGRLGQPALTLPAPPLLKDYNNFMGGVDRNDQMRKYYSLIGRSKSWCQKLVEYLLEVAIHNSRVVLESVKGSRVDGALYRMELATDLIGDVRVKTKDSRPTVHCCNGNHFPKRNADGVKRACRVCTKEYHDLPPEERVARPSRTVFICEGCGVPLCVGSEKECFKLYHTEEMYRHDM